MSDRNENGENQEEHKPHHMGVFHAPGGDHEEEHDGAPEWLISFADMVMLIMGFFVILYALNATPPQQAGAEGDSSGDSGSSVPFDRWAEFVWETREAFGNPIDMNTTDPELRRIVDWKRSEGPGTADQEGEAGERSEVRSPRDAGQQSAMVEIVFDHDSSTLAETELASIRRLIEKVRGMPTMIEIHGHSSKEESSRDPQNGFDLSYQRARSVSRILQENGIPARRIKIVAAGDNDPLKGHPIDARDDAPNRRVEIRVTDRMAVGQVRSETSLKGS